MARVDGPTFFADANGIRIAYERAGNGYPLLLLHGYPQTRRMWRRVMPLLSERFAMAAMDLRGCGDSDAPADEASYDKRTMAADALALAEHLGWERFLVAGHDRGGRVARRLAADHPDAVAGAVLLDILPMEWVYSQGEGGYARRYWHWYFQLQRGVAEAVIGADPQAYAGWFFSRSAGRLDPADVRHYIQAFARPATIAATLADYRTAFEVDRPRWEEEARKGIKVQAPILALWGGLGNLADAPVLDIWRKVAVDVDGEEVAGSGHYVAEERPRATAEAITRFAQRLGL